MPKVAVWSLPSLSEGKMPGRWPKVAKGRWPRALKRPLQASTTLFLGRAPPAVAWGRRIFGGSEVVSRGRRKGLWTLSKVIKT